MEKEFVTYKQALALNQLGFDENCIAKHGYFDLYINEEDGHLPAPLKQQAFRWFREVTDWDFAIIKEFHDKEYPYYFYILFADTSGLNKHCKNYDEAELLLINELIENYKEKQNGSI